MSDKELKIKFRYEQDSKRYHRFKIIDPQGYVTGSVYFSKDMEELPAKVVLELESK